QGPTRRGSSPRDQPRRQREPPGPQPFPARVRFHGNAGPYSLARDPRGHPLHGLAAAGRLGRATSPEPRPGPPRTCDLVRGPRSRGPSPREHDRLSGDGAPASGSPFGPAAPGHRSDHGDPLRPASHRGAGLGLARRARARSPGLRPDLQRGVAVRPARGRPEIDPRPARVTSFRLAASAFLSMLALTPGAHAQPASNAGPGAPQVVSPEVAADRRVTFRLYSPNAKLVTLNGDFFAEASAGPAM